MEVNLYKQDWMNHAGMMYDDKHSENTTQSSTFHVPDIVGLHSAVTKTARAVALGIAISTVDGPLPIADVVGFAVASALSVKAWHDYLTE